MQLRAIQSLTTSVLMAGITGALGAGTVMAHARTGLESAAAATATQGGHVGFIAEGQSIPASKTATVNLHFRVDPGFHINSHTPKSDMLIPTRLVVATVPGDPEVTAVDFPAGVPFAFAFEPKQKLDVYQGDVVLVAHVKAAPGQHSIKAELHYQACDQAACYPPKTLVVEQPFTAR